MLEFSAVFQIWKKFIQKLNDWDLPLRVIFTLRVATALPTSNIIYMCHGIVNVFFFTNEANPYIIKLLVKCFI